MFINNIHPRGNCNTYTEMLKTTNAHALYGVSKQPSSSYI